MVLDWCIHFLTLLIQRWLIIVSIIISIIIFDYWSYFSFRISNRRISTYISLWAISLNSLGFIPSRVTAFLGLLLSNNIAFRFARPKMRVAFKPAGPPPIIAQSNSVSILFQVQFFRHRIVKAGCRWKFKPCRQNCIIQKTTAWNNSLLNYNRSFFCLYSAMCISFRYNSGNSLFTK